MVKAQTRPRLRVSDVTDPGRIEVPGVNRKFIEQQ